MPLFNDDSSLVCVPHPGFISGRYYASTTYSTTNTLSCAAGFVYYTYFFVSYTQAFNRIAFSTNTSFSPSQAARFGIYKVSSGLPTSLLFDLGTISFAIPGIKEISCSITLAPGWYAIALVFTTAMNLVSPAMFSNLYGQTNVSASTTVNGFRATLTYGTLPSTASLTNLTEFYSPLMWLKAA